MTLSELTALIKKIIPYTDLHEDITPLLNQGVNEIAGGMKSSLGSWVTPPLPELFSISSVETDTATAFVQMPDTFQRGLLFAASDYEIDIAEDWFGFISSYPLLDSVGQITSVIERGGNLYYQGSPSESTTIIVHFFRFPIDMEDDDDEPDGIPGHLQKGLLVNYVAWKLYELVENGIDGKFVNIEKYRTLFYQSLEVLELTIPYETRKIEFKHKSS